MLSVHARRAVGVVGSMSAQARRGTAGRAVFARQAEKRRSPAVTGATAQVRAPRKGRGSMSPVPNPTYGCRTAALSQTKNEDCAPVNPEQGYSPGDRSNVRSVRMQQRGCRR